MQSMHKCSMTMHFPADTLGAMKEHWTIRYLEYVKQHSGRTLTAIAREAGISSTTLTRPVNDPEHPYEVKIQNIEKVSQVTGIPFQPFKDSDTSTPLEIPNGDPAPQGTHLIPIYNVEASAGNGAHIGDEYQVASLSFPEGYLQRITRAQPRNLAVISVKGDSMTPTLFDDDVVMIDTTKRDLSYDGLFVIRDNGDALLVKRIGRASRSGFVSMISDNKEQYPAVERALGDIEVVGKVIWKGGKV